MYKRYIKRILDFIIAFIGLLLFIPVFMVIHVAL